MVGTAGDSSRKSSRKGEAKRGKPDMSALLDDEEDAQTQDVKRSRVGILCDCCGRIPSSQVSVIVRKTHNPWVLVAAPTQNPSSKGRHG